MMVARLGSASAAATELGLHRATVTRHIETVEAALGTTLFLRHARGLKITDAGKDMLEVADRVDDMFNDLQGKTRNKNGQLSGDLIITSLTGVMPLIAPAIRAFKDAYPAISVSLLAGTELAQLEYGEAHVAVRAGLKPTVPDYVVRPFREVHFGFYAHRDYIREARKLKKNISPEDYQYIGPSDDFTGLNPFYSNLFKSTIPNANIILKVNDFESNVPAVLAGLGVGMIADHVAENFVDLVAVIPPSEDRCIYLWTITHRDLNKVSKVQEFIRILRETATY